MPIFMDAPYYPKKLLMAQLREAAPSMESVVGALDGAAFAHFGSFGDTGAGNPAWEAPVETALSELWDVHNPPVQSFLSGTAIEVDPTQIQVIQGLNGVLPSGADSIISNLCRTGPVACDLFQSEEHKSQCRAIFTSTCVVLGKGNGNGVAPPSPGMSTTTKTLLIGGGVLAALVAVYLMTR